MKAYIVYPGDNPYDEGCVLVFAHDRNQARLMAYRKGPWNYDYIELNARRVKSVALQYLGYDIYAKGGEPCLFEANEGLPEPFFYEEEA